MKLYAFILVLCFCIWQCGGSSFSEFKTEMEAVALSISSKMEQYYEQWCVNGQATCETLSTNSCVGVEKTTCDYTLPSLAICLQSGFLSTNTSNIKFPPDIDYSSLSDEQIKYICASAKLQSTFYENLKLNQKNQVITSMYFGSNRGIFRQFPGNYHGNQKNQCDDYDPRYRPWYTIAASGAKNIIILLDKSGSMTKQGKLEVAKSAVSSVIDTLSISDNVAIILFENQTENIGLAKLSKASYDYKQELKNYIKDIQSNNGETNFMAAFKKGLEMVIDGITTGQSGCSQAQTVFLLLTDGNPTQDNTSVDVLINMIRSNTGNDSQIKRDIIIFTYALGSNVNTQYLRKLSCSFKGMIILETNLQNGIKSNSAFVTKLREFYVYLSVGVKFERPVWTEPYTDYYGYGRMVTVSMPAYYIDTTTNLSNLIGVTGVDIMMTQFDKYGYSEQDIIIQLIGEGACQKNELTDCQLEALRSDKFRCNITNCTISLGSQVACLSTPKTNQIFKNVDLYKNDYKCCGITVNNFIITMVFSIIGLIVIVILFALRKKISRNFCDRSYKHVRKHSDFHQDSQKTSSNNSVKRKMSKKGESKSSSVDQSASRINSAVI